MSDLNGTSPGKIAIEIETGKLWIACSREHRNFNNACPDKYTQQIVLTALRAYADHIHDWDEKEDGRMWWWNSDDGQWMRRCVSCQAAESYDRLIPEGDGNAD